MIFLDATPIVALCDRRDSLHIRAKRDLDELRKEPMATCEAVVAEACFLLPQSPERARLRRLLDQLGVVTIPSSVERSLWTEVLTWLLKYEEHEPDFADGALAVLSGKHRSARVWTYDSQFETLWRRPDGSRIPVAVGLF